jgi:hypothetical protein
MDVNDKQLSAVLKLPGRERFKHFVIRVVDEQVAWALFREGWALAATDDGQTVFPLWPAQRYADICATGDWDGYESVAIPLDDLLAELLPNLERDGVLPGVFFVPNGAGVTPSVQELRAALDDELQRY